MNRVALYLGDGRETSRLRDLRPYFQGARASGLRIVTVMSEGRTAHPGRRPVLKRLVARMEAGEFEAIVTVVPAALPASALSRPKRRRPYRPEAGR